MPVNTSLGLSRFGRRDQILIVIARLQKIDSFFTHPIDDSMFLGQATRPRSGQHILERLRLANANEGITHHGLNQIKSPERDVPIRLNPMTQIFKKLWLERRDPRLFLLRLCFTLFRQAPVPYAKRLLFLVWAFELATDSERS